MNKNDEFENNDIENDIDFEKTDSKGTIDDIDVSDIFGEEEIPFAIDESLLPTLLHQFPGIRLPK